MRIAKQIIIMRTDLKMNVGKIAAQAAHASMKVIMEAGSFSPNESGGDDFQLFLDRNTALSDWLFGQFTKIVVGIDSEEEMLEIYNKCKELNILTALITDNGKTTFNNVPTNTCIAVGPAYADEIDKITGHLKLFK